MVIAVFTRGKFFPAGFLFQPASRPEPGLVANVAAA